MSRQASEQLMVYIVQQPWLWSMTKRRLEWYEISLPMSGKYVKLGHVSELRMKSCKILRCKLQTHGAEQLLELWLLRLEIVWRWQWSITLYKIVALIFPGGCGKSIARPHNFHDSFAQTARATCKKPPWQWHELRWNGSVLQFQTFGISTLGKWV